MQRLPLAASEKRVYTEKATGVNVMVNVEP